MSSCKECGHPTEWAQDIGSAVCTQCGTLADSSQQSALTSSAEFFSDTYLPSSSRPTTLKSIRRNAAWDLPGQGTDSRNVRNKLTTHEIIRTLADRLGHHGVATRAQTIFDLAMQRTSMKWGKAAKLAAGAAFVFALREQGLGDRTYHVAYLLSELVVTLKRTQLHLLPHLDLTLPRTHPCVHLPVLVSHLSVVASASPSSLPKDTLAFLRPLVLSPAMLQNVLRTARALHDLLILESCVSSGVSAGATACALLLLALEAHAHPPRSVPHVLVLAAQLGAALDARGATIMARYRILVDTFADSASHVPWLASSSAAGSKRVSRRSAVARAVLDVLEFTNEVGRAEIAERGGPITVDVEGEGEGEGEGVGVEEGDQGEEAALDAMIAKVELEMTDNTVPIPRMPKGTHATPAVPVRRRYKKPRTTTGQAACFLLDPLAHAVPTHTALAHTTYLLSSDAVTGSAVPPTRLQLLTVERGNAEAIHDDELFGDGELDAIMIGTDEQASEERGRRAQALQMMWGEEDAQATMVDLGVETGREGDRKMGKERMDMNKLAALLYSDDPFAALAIEGLSRSKRGDGARDDGTVSVGSSGEGLEDECVETASGR